MYSPPLWCQFRALFSVFIFGFFILYFFKKYNQNWKIFFTYMFPAFEKMNQPPEISTHFSGVRKNNSPGSLFRQIRVYLRFWIFLWHRSTVCLRHAKLEHRFFVQPQRPVIIFQWTLIEWWTDWLIDWLMDVSERIGGTGYEQLAWQKWKICRFKMYCPGSGIALLDTEHDDNVAGLITHKQTSSKSLLFLFKVKWVHSYYSFSSYTVLLYFVVFSNKFSARQFHQANSN